MFKIVLQQFYKLGCLLLKSAFKSWLLIRLKHIWWIIYHKTSLHHKPLSLKKDNNTELLKSFFTVFLMKKHETKKSLYSNFIHFITNFAKPSKKWKNIYIQEFALFSWWVRENIFERFKHWSWNNNLPGLFSFNCRFIFPLFFLFFNRDS